MVFEHNGFKDTRIYVGCQLRYKKTFLKRIRETGHIIKNELTDLYAHSSGDCIRLDPRTFKEFQGKDKAYIGLQNIGVFSLIEGELKINPDYAREPSKKYLAFIKKQNARIQKIRAEIDERTQEEWKEATPIILDKKLLDLFKENLKPESFENLKKIIKEMKGAN